MRLYRGARPSFWMTAVLLAGAMAIASNASAKPKVNRVTQVKVNKTGEATTVVVKTSGVPQFSAQVAQGGKRLIIDLIGTDVSRAVRPMFRPKGVVGGVVVQPYHTSAGSTARVFVQLRKPAAYRVRAEGDQLVVSLRPSDKTEADARPMTGAVSAHGAMVRPVASEDVARVESVSFHHEDQLDSIFVDLGGHPQVTKSSPRAGVSRLVFHGVRAGQKVQKMVDAGLYGGVVRSVSSYVTGVGADRRVVIEVVHDDRAVAVLKREGNRLVWTFGLPSKLPSSLTGVGLDGKPARKVRTVAREPKFEGIPHVYDGMSAAEQPVESASELSEASAFLPGQAAYGQHRTKRRYRGRRIELDLKDSDIHDALRLLADVGGVNVVIADNVKGTVTIRMRNVPWDRAMDVVLQAKGLGMVREGNIIRVAPLADLEKEREMALARRKQEYELSNLETRIIPVSYASASDMQNRAKDLLSPRGSIAVDERTNVMIVRDIPGNLNQVEELVRSLDTQTPQVLVEARVVEATSRYMRDIGVQWGGDAAFSAATGNPTGLAFPSSVGVVGGASDNNAPTMGLSPFANRVENPNFAVNLPATVGTGTGGAIGLSLGHINNTFNLNLRLSAAETSGMIRIISSPRILTLDNHEATISQGTMIPFSQVSAMGVQTTFREAKLELKVRPHVTADGSVAMHVKVNRDEPDFTQTSARGDPTILKREAETELLVMDGHTAVIGGIFTRNTGRNLDQVPFFGDIPIIGLLFQRRRASDARGELVIFITPRIVNRAEALGH